MPKTAPRWMRPPEASVDAGYHRARRGFGWRGEVLVLWFWWSWCCGFGGIGAVVLVVFIAAFLLCSSGPDMICVCLSACCLCLPSWTDISVILGPNDDAA